ncbi:MAG: hypothetical protein HUJ93_04275 [Bacteroidales bacterium]|nr:hypothetical protein [Bacteroidales bacterium]
MEHFITYFSEEQLAVCGVPEALNDPLRYWPHPLSQKAADIARQSIEKLPDEIRCAFAQGKMLGVLIIRDSGGRIGFLKGFSGIVAGKSNIEGFVPPIIDLTDANGFFKKGEKELDAINFEVNRMTDSEIYKNAQKNCAAATLKMQRQLDEYRTIMAEAKRKRDIARSNDSKADQVALERESQFMKAEFKRLKIALQREVTEAQYRLAQIQEPLEELKQKRKLASENLQRELFKAYLVHNINGGESDIWNIFQRKGSVPPGGTGECAGVKLLEFAIINNLEPLALGEFWCGTPIIASTRLRGFFYPSCTSKCAPVIEYMLCRKTLSKDIGKCPELTLIYQDNSIVAIDKPSGIPSVPGLAPVEDAQTALQRQLGINLYSVHRLDMDTSGTLIFARNEAIQSKMMTMFANSEIDKRYLGVLVPGKAISGSGKIDLPISADYAERPRQKAGCGKESVTEYKIIREMAEGRTLAEFHPLNGRTHQIRIHCANSSGLGRPLLGDTLYGNTASTPEKRLFLHSYKTTFPHPETGEVITISSHLPAWAEDVK